MSGLPPVVGAGLQDAAPADRLPDQSKSSASGY
jgi:hypothetical protein